MRPLMSKYPGDKFLADSLHAEARNAGLILRNKASEWDERLFAASPLLEKAYSVGLKPTPYFVEAYHYWGRAKFLQDRNLGLRLKSAKSGCDLQDHIPIYDTVQRRYAGFSNVLEQLKYGDKAPKFRSNLERGFHFPEFNGGAKAWLYVCLAHRITGSGASFEFDHGWRNTIVPEMATATSGWRSDNQRIQKMAAWIHENQHRKMFTSIGNQIPPFNKIQDPSTFRLAGIEYLSIIAPKLVDKVWNWFDERDKLKLGTAGIKVAVDKILGFQRDLGCRQFKFVLTAWVMDMAEYVPYFVEPNSDCYHGKNAQEALSVCFTPLSKIPAQEFFDRGTRLFCDVTNTYPMDVEDATPGCDLIRWLENYVPRKGFEYVVRHKIFNNSTLRYFKGRQPEHV